MATNMIDGNQHKSFKNSDWDSAYCYFWRLVKIGPGIARPAMSLGYTGALIFGNLADKNTN